jgi:Na+-transporting NADH:ubiquinone oxidoreductase subunit C
MRNNDTILKTLIVAVTLCLVCSAVISSVAVGLRDLQEANKKLDQQTKILAAAQLLDETKTVQELFTSIEAKIVNLETGEYNNIIDVGLFDEASFSRDEATSMQLSSKQDIAIIKRRENYQKIYLHSQDEKLTAVILPVRGYGLWGTLYGYLAVEPDFQTVIGLEFFQHKETPGLGAEVDNPKWKSQWKGKKIFSDKGDVMLSVIKGSVKNNSPNAPYQVDGLSGATITSKGVSNLLSFWLGDLGYKPYMQRMLMDLEINDV